MLRVLLPVNFQRIGSCNANAMFSCHPKGLVIYLCIYLFICMWRRILFFSLASHTSLFLRLLCSFLVAVVAFFCTSVFVVVSSIELFLCVIWMHQTNYIIFVKIRMTKQMNDRDNTRRANYKYAIMGMDLTENCVTIGNPHICIYIQIVRILHIVSALHIDCEMIVLMQYNCWTPPEHKSQGAYVLIVQCTALYKMEKCQIICVTLHIVMPMRRVLLIRRLQFIW